MRPEILVLVGLETLLGLSEDPGTLVGHGPLPAEMVREAAAEGVWRCAVVDDVHGTLLGLGRSTYTPEYRPGRPLHRFVGVRDQLCTFPGCRQPGHRCDRDHRDPHPDGETCECNIGLLCRHHHRLKHEAGFTVRRVDDESAAPGSVVWTTPAGRHYIRRPPDLRPPGPIPSHPHSPNHPHSPSHTRSPSPPTAPSTAPTTRPETTRPETTSPSPPGTGPPPPF